MLQRHHTICLILKWCCPALYASYFFGFLVVSFFFFNLTSEDFFKILLSIWEKTMATGRFSRHCTSVRRDYRSLMRKSVQGKFKQLSKYYTVMNSPLGNDIEMHCFRIHRAKSELIILTQAVLGPPFLYGSTDLKFLLVTIKLPPQNI